MLWFFKQFIIRSCLCFSAPEELRYSVSAAVHNLVAIAAVALELHCMCFYTGVWVLVTVSSFVHSWLNKTVEWFLRNILHKTAYLCNSQPQLQENSRGLMRTPFYQVKLDINIFWNWVNVSSTSAYIFFRSRLSFLLTKMFLKIDENWKILALNFSGTSMSPWT